MPYRTPCKPPPCNHTFGPVYVIGSYNRWFCADCGAEASKLHALILDLRNLVEGISQDELAALIEEALEAERNKR